MGPNPESTQKNTHVSANYLVPDTDTSGTPERSVVDIHIVWERGVSPCMVALQLVLRKDACEILGFAVGVLFVEMPFDWFERTHGDVVLDSVVKSTMESAGNLGSLQTPVVRQSHSDTKSPQMVRSEQVLLVVTVAA